MSDKPEKLVMCVNRRYQLGQRSCAGSGGKAIAEALEKGIAARKINIGVHRIVCLGQCSRGPSMRLAPGGRFFFEMSLEKVSALLDELEAECGTRIEGDGPPAHLLGS
jgi:(2Fe-2S) ferredoxin